MAEFLQGPALEDRVRLVFDVPLAAELGLRLIDPADPGAGAAFTVAGIASNGAGGVHAAAVGAALELAAYLALAPKLAETEHAVTHASAVQLISGAAEGELVEVRGVLERRTRRLAFCIASATVGDRIVARAQLTKSVVPFTNAPPAGD
jgi:acyl-coenzyme A thioesterase PaaI-like protein